MKKLFQILLLIISVNSFGQITDVDYQEYKKNIQGRFSSYPQTLVDSTRSDVLIRTKFLWKRDGWDWFYTQQGEWYKNEFYPYRARLYKTQNQGEHILLEIHTVDNVPYDIMKEIPKESQTNETFEIDIQTLADKLTKEGSVHKEGCDIKIIKVFQKDEKPILYGSTNESDCVATFRGSTYTKVQFLILPQFLVSWERGYNDKDEQVWGPTQGPYIFFKVNQN